MRLELQYPQTVTLRANCCSDQRRLFRDGFTKKSRLLTDQHSEEHGFDVSAIGIEYEINRKQNTITVKKNFESYDKDARFDWYHHLTPGVIITCQKCNRVTCHWFGDLGWVTAQPLTSSFRCRVTLNWVGAPTERNWLNIQSIDYHTSSSWPNNDQRTVYCLADISKALIKFGRSDVYNHGEIAAVLMYEFWEAYATAESDIVFNSRFNQWSAKMSNAYHDVLRVVQKRRENAEENLSAYVAASEEAARIIYSLRDSQGKGVRSKQLQAARHLLEDARKHTGNKPIEYEVTSTVNAELDCL